MKDRALCAVWLLDCILIETQWEKQSNGSRVLWEETKIPLRGASLVDFAATAQIDTAPRASTILDATDHPEKPLASITMAAQKGMAGVVEMLATRRARRVDDQAQKAEKSPRIGGGTHVTFPASVF